MGAAFGGRWAAIDIGTNSVRLLVAEVRGDTVVPVSRALRLTRLGQGVDRERRLAPEAAARTVAAVGELVQQARAMQAEDIVIAGTSALRDARDREDFCRAVERTTGLPVYVLSGPGEAAVSFMGAVRGLASVAGGGGAGGGAAVGGEGAGAAREVWVVDVGGGSTEVVRGTAQGQVAGRASADVGAVRMTEATVRSDPVSAEDWRHLTAAIEQGLAPLWQALLGDGPAEGAPAPAGGLLVGVGGTVTTLAAMEQRLDPYDPDKVHGYRLSRSAVAVMLERMRAATVAQRRTWPGLQPQRADIILAGTAIVLAVMTRLGADSLLVSEADLLDGLILWAARLGRDPAYLVDGAGGAN
ncbi:MAG TPA: hypothetical protein VIK98_06415 [Limnochordales bacterium]